MKSKSAVSNICCYWLREISRLEECKKIIDTRNVEASDSMKRMQEQQLLFINSFKKISDAISKCRKVEDFLTCTKKFQ